MTKVGEQVKPNIDLGATQEKHFIIQLKEIQNGKMVIIKRNFLNGYLKLQKTDRVSDGSSRLLEKKKPRASLKFTILDH